MATAAGESSLNSTLGFFAVEVKVDCPHLQNALKTDLSVDINAACITCLNVGENWLCLSCSNVYCSRYVKEHMVHHNEESQHPVALSFSDASVWCYECESYIDSPVLRQICQSVALAKT